MARPDPFLAFEAALPTIIAESPSTILRRREVSTDTFRDPSIFTAGPYTVRIEMESKDGQQLWDEKGGVSTKLFKLVGHNLPRKVAQGGGEVPLFKTDDTVTDQDDNVYRVSGPQYVRGKVVIVPLELRG